MQSLNSLLVYITAWSYFASLIHVETLIKEVLVNNWRKISSQPAGFCTLRKQVSFEDMLRYIP